ncbi:FtsK/SpoIIIE family DNA translocase [Pandoraea sputorum]|uniref:FtsK/SpoIIIE family DNA translocase n=1 Tax=Pandoraea sputorum TaxID=93222 RepID=UPI00124277A0|nr:DNA translocase FtsK [Pandoraea sputorum]VVE74700.1 DNA translocase FtsK [Pandoraea sputorum]
MGFGWFGLSTFWLLALCWPGVRGLLGGEIRIFGPGTLRMLLGVPLAMVSSATLAALTGGDGNTAGGSIGQSLSHGLSVALGGTLAMGLSGFVLLFSLPLVFGTTWWGMVSRRPSADDEDDAPAFDPRDARESRESRFDTVAREPVRGLSQMSFDTSERGERSYTPTVGQGHHNVGSLIEEPVPRRRGLAAQPRWKLSDEERARLDAMQPPPLTMRGAPRAEPTFGASAATRPAGKGTSVGRTTPVVAAAVGAAGAVGSSGGAAAATAAATRAVLPRGAYAAKLSRGEALRTTEFVRAEPGLTPRGPRPAASSQAPVVQRPASVSTNATPATNTASHAEPLDATSLPGATGYRRPVGMAPAHLRGTVVHSPFRKPQLGLEDIPPRGAPPRPQGLTSQTPSVAGDEASTQSATNAAASAPAAPASPALQATQASQAAPVMRGAASWSAADAAVPLASDVAEFSPIDWSVNDVVEPSTEPVPEGPSPEMLAEQEAAREAARAAEQARIDAMIALRQEAEALLRDLRDWASPVSSDASDAPTSPQPSDAVAVDTFDAMPKSLDSDVDIAIPEIPSLAASPEVVEAEPLMPPPVAPLTPAEVLNLPPVMQFRQTVAPASGAAMPSSVPPRPFVFADVLASVEAYDATVTAPATQTVTAQNAVTLLENAAEASAEDDALPPFDVAERVVPVDIDEAPEPSAKPHYVLRADGTWARADGLPLTSDDTTSFAQPTPEHLPPATPVIPAIPSFAAASPASQTASFTADMPYELPPPRVAIDYDLPALDLLAPATASDHANVVSDEALAAVSQLIEQRLAEFKVPVTVVGASAGPVITRFEVEPAVGVRGAQVVGLMKDLARALGVTSIRVVETIPGKTCMGLELPNAQRQMIRLSEILNAPVFDTHRSRLALAMGKDITGEPIVADLARAPHLLVAGTTGSGKSVAVNAMILSLLYKATPDDVRLIMIDPKMLELSVYGGIPHLLAPVVTDMKQAAHALNWCVGEMEKRYRLMSALGVRNLAGYNEKIDAAHAAGEKVSNPFSLTPDAPEPLDRLPFIVVVIDELADLMMVAGKKIEELIARLAQKARAAGIHLILATQRPSVDVITGLIKANIPTRVAFQVSSKIDSRTILDQMGAESLLGQGDMLFLPPGTGYPQRVHGAFVADDEVHRVVQHWQLYGEPDYDEAILAGDPADAASADLFGDAAGDAEADPLYDEAAAFVLNSRRASISAVQRQLRIGYNRAARLIEQMEAAGLVTPMGRNGTREVVAPGE